MDAQVKAVQDWLIATFPSQFNPQTGVYPLKNDGITGGTTVKALVMAVQLHYNLDPDGIWGNGTSSACADINADLDDPILIKIAQRGFFCKGYNPGAFDGIYGPAMNAAIRRFKEDLGFDNPNGTLTPIFFKSLLTTDPTFETTGSDPAIRIAQQHLNRNYSSLFLSSLGYIPTGGFYDRKTSKALIYAFQKEIGTTPDGALGPNTFNKMPVLTPSSTNSALIKILQCALSCNGYPVRYLTGKYDSSLSETVNNFQIFMCLDKDPAVTPGEVNRRTWGALLWSKGDTERTPNACDCRQRLDSVKAQSLYRAGYRYVGRYLTKVTGGYDKNLTPEEITAITSAGLKIFPIFQEANDKLADFTYSSGYFNGYDAIMAATKLRITPNTTIYFAVDCDVTEAQAKNQITNYFKGIADAWKNTRSNYMVGIYSARNTCSIICNAGLAHSSFVSDMSTGYSGNLGYRLPDNWAYDQYRTGSFTASDGSKFDLDGNIASPNAKYFSSIKNWGDDYWALHLYNIRLDLLQKYTKQATNVTSVIPVISELEDIFWTEYPDKTPLDCLYGVLYCLWDDKYGSGTGTFLNQFLLLLHADSKFLDTVRLHYNEVYDKIIPYISGNYTFLKDDFPITESLPDDNIPYTYHHLLELPHLAIIISAYTDLKLTGDMISASPAWFGWAGDLATGFKEIDLLKKALGPDFDSLLHARDRIGKMEEKETTGDVQMNFCDIVADADAIGIYAMIQKLLATEGIDHNHLLSDALYYYYGTDLYKQRNNYLLNELHPSEYTVDAITQCLIDYFEDSSNALLLTLKAETKDPDVIAACSRSYAEIIVHDLNSYS